MFGRCVTVRKSVQDFGVDAIHEYEDSVRDPGDAEGDEDDEE